jgi:hypothetical protein
MQKRKNNYISKNGNVIVKHNDKDHKDHERGRCNAENQICIAVGFYLLLEGGKKLFTALYNVICENEVA